MGHYRNLQIRRRCRWVRGVAYAVFCIAVIVGGAVLIGGCANSAGREEVKLRMQVAELTQERNDLILYAIKQDEYIRQLHGGMEIQARRNAQLLDGCSI